MQHLSRIQILRVEERWLPLLEQGYNADLVKYAVLALGASLFFCWAILRRISVPRTHTTPYSIPLLRCTIPFVFDGLSFLKHASKLIPSPSTIRIPIFMDEVFIVQGPKHVAEIFQNPHLVVTRAYSLVLKQCFGMKQEAVNAYLSDSSGSRPRPIPGSNPQPLDRISLMTHENLVSGLLQEGLSPAAEKFEAILDQSLLNEALGHESILGRHSWREEPDLDHFFQHHLGTSLVKTLFGEHLTVQNPNFIDDLWEYDAHVMRLAQRTPSFWIPQAYQVRDRLLNTVKKWHSQAVIYLNGSKSHTNLEADHWWGTKMMNKRCTMLLNATGQDLDSVASTDLALIWASVTNVVPSSMTLAYHIYNTPSHLSALRNAIALFQQPPTFKHLESIPLLASMYAESLRFGVQIHIPRSSPYHEMHIGGVEIQRDKLILVNTWLAHTDEREWNTRRGERPLDQFWAERFLVDPSDEDSGPKRKGNTKESTPQDQPSGLKDVRFSVEGLDGVWIPFGGGQHACPGRLLAKRIMLLSAAILVSKFDINFDQSDTSVTFGSARFGFGVRKPQRPVRFRIRRR